MQRRSHTLFGAAAIGFALLHEAPAHADDPVLVPPMLAESAPAQDPRAGAVPRFVVELELDIDRNGKVIDARVIRSGGAVLDTAALASARGFTFMPGTRDGKSIPARIRYEVVFAARDGEVDMIDGLVRIVAPMPGTPAARAGLQAGDLIVRFDDQPVLGMALTDAIYRMRGQPGTPIVLRIRRAGSDDEFAVSLVRETIRTEPLRWSMEGDVLVLRLASFTASVTTGLERALAEATAATTPRAIVLDGECPGLGRGVGVELRVAAVVHRRWDPWLATCLTSPARSTPRPRRTAPSSRAAPSA